MSTLKELREHRRTLIYTGVVVTAFACVAMASIIDLTMRDFFLPGTQVGEIGPSIIHTSDNCRMCHGGIDVATDPSSTWSGSLMALAGRDPLFFAQMTTANQDVANAGNFCMRCHVPNSFITGHANQPLGDTLDATDKDGVSCHFCHSMVDPIYRAGISPPEDEAIFVGLVSGPPDFYGNAMFVLDPTGARRGPRHDAAPPHELIPSAFHSSSNFCGTCHEVGNVAVSRNPNGTYRYNAIDQPTHTPNPDDQFPLERTFSEWKNSSFANGGVDMGGRFGGANASVVSTCQDCHMPRAEGMASIFGPNRTDLRTHEFAGASAQVLDIIAKYTTNDPNVDQAAIVRGRAAAVSMLERAATIEIEQQDTAIRVRLTNQSGHKLPTGHIEGRRVWVNVKFFDESNTLVGEYGAYDLATAELDEHSATIYEMHVGLSPEAAAITRLPAGPTGHMALADTIEKDNRIPPRGFTNAAFEAAGAPVVGSTYADGQYWHDTFYNLPRGAVRAEARAFYQNTPKHYIEMLRDNNVTDEWGNILYTLWEQTGKGAPIQMAFVQSALATPCFADFNGDGALDMFDYRDFVIAFASNQPESDYNQDEVIDFFDYLDFVDDFSQGC